MKNIRFFFHLKIFLFLVFKNFNIFEWAYFRNAKILIYDYSWVKLKIVTKQEASSKKEDKRRRKQIIVGIFFFFFFFFNIIIEVFKTKPSLHPKL